ncbi:hypothetical protein [Streptomyces cupreus]|uniref:Uncharacterized protein n=1 Tax=Streptomyces cupreus TaxID=2759956 RepID=A0A7X1J522_9ACTN|nr:hypothetical protein [Streptomyces cupreus]MBC2904290.1 hypothetical protein [Streptomyces cupreus]
MLLSALNARAQDRYDTYVEHLKTCPNCWKAPHTRCPDGQALCRAYLAAAKPTS